MVSAGVGEDDQRVCSGLWRGISDRLLGPWRAEDGEDVLGCWRNILARMRQCRWIPDLAGEQPVPCVVASVNGTHANRESAASQRIVRVTIDKDAPFSVSLLLCVDTVSSVF